MPLSIIGPSPASFPELEAAARFTPEINERAAEIEAARRMPADLARKLAGAGLFRLCIPRQLGGSELNPLQFAQIVEEVSRADGSAGWCVMIGALGGLFGGLLPASAAQSIYGDPMIITGGGLAPTGQATPADGGYRVSGRWAWGSGIQNCQWVSGGALVMDAGKPRVHPNGEPQLWLMYFPAKDVEIIDTWDAVGLRGSGSHDFTVRNVFVPHDYAALVDAEAEPALRQPLYFFPLFGFFGLAVASVAIGIAHRAIDELVKLAGHKRPTFERQTLKESPRMQESVAEAVAMVRAARAFLVEATHAAWEFSSRCEPSPVTVRRDLRLAAATAAWQAVRAVDLMYHAGGGSTVHSSNPLQRCMRDAHVVTQHAVVNRTVIELSGRRLMGIETPSQYL